MTNRQATMIEPDRMEAILHRANTMRAEYLRSIFAATGRSFGRGFSAILARIRSSRIMNELYALSDRELADIGLTRHDIPYLAKQIGRGQPVDTATALSNARYHDVSAVPANSDRPELVSADVESRHAA